MEAKCCLDESADDIDDAAVGEADVAAAHYLAMFLLSTLLPLSFASGCDSS